MDKDFVNKFGKNLKLIRKAKGLTQDDFDCDRISRSMISLLEIGRTDITLTKLKAIADILNVSVKDLFDFE